MILNRTASGNRPRGAGVPGEIDRTRPAAARCFSLERPSVRCYRRDMARNAFHGLLPKQRRTIKRYKVAGLTWGIIETHPKKPTTPTKKDAPALLFLPGTLGTAEIFGNQIEALADRVRVVSVISHLRQRGQAGRWRRRTDGTAGDSPRRSRGIVAWRLCRAVACGAAPVADRGTGDWQLALESGRIEANGDSA